MYHADVINRHESGTNFTAVAETYGVSSMRRAIIVDYDATGNPITYMENVDGTWTNLYAETIVDADFMQRHFPHLLNG